MESKQQGRQEIGQVQVFFNDSSRKIEDDGYAKRNGNWNMRLTKVYRNVDGRPSFVFGSYKITAPDGSRSEENANERVLDHLVKFCGLDRRSVISITDDTLKAMAGMNENQ